MQTAHFLVTLHLLLLLNKNMIVSSVCIRRLQSGLKAFGFDRGVTVQGGLSVPITTPAHGTAFDIAGKNIANLDPTLQSFKIALKMSQSYSNE